LLPRKGSFTILRKAVIPAAGLGTRLLPATKEQPKEMLPIFASYQRGLLCLKPIAQQIFEQLFEIGIRHFYFIVGREKRAIEDHFTPDREFVRRVLVRRKSNQASYLEHFYEKIEKSTITWVNQPAPRGFGHAILQIEQLMSEEPFLVHAGDTYVISKTDNVLGLIQTHANSDATATLTIKEVQDPRNYGVAVVSAKKGNLRVERVVEKPTRPPTKLAIMPIYIFEPIIFDALRRIRPGHGEELQLTDGIQRLIEGGYKVQAMKLRDNDVRLDVGTPENYWEALRLSYRYASRGKTETRV
jgi:UTP--glucose-1-phosphate uridylyltransferase